MVQWCLVNGTRYLVNGTRYLVNGTMVHWFNVSTMVHAQYCVLVSALVNGLCSIPSAWSAQDCSGAVDS